MLPILLRLGPVTVYSLGFFLFLGFLLACFVVWKQAKTSGLPQEEVLDTLFLTVFFGLIAGRLGYVAVSWPTFTPDFSRVIFFLKYPGLSLPVLLLAVLIFSWLLAKKSSLETLWIWDTFAIAAAFLAVFANLGCYLDRCFPAGPNVPLILTISGMALVAVCLILMRKFGTLAGLAELSKKRGIFLLCYLIFQLASLLMTAGWVGDWSRVAVYGVGLVLVIIILVVRYQLLFKYLYDAVSQRRAGTS